MGAWIKHHPLKCTGCSKEWPFPDWNHIYQYTDLVPTRVLKGEEVDPAKRPRLDSNRRHHWDMLLTPAWCLECERATLVERIPTIQEFANAAALRKIPDSDTARAIHDPLLSMEEEEFRMLFDTCNGRKAPAKCILCGSSSNVTVNPWARGETGLTHEACWDSPIRTEGTSMGGSIGMRSTMGIYLDKQGDLAWADILHGKTYGDRMGARFQVPKTHPEYRALRRIIGTVYLGIEDESAARELELFGKDDDPAALGMLGALYHLGFGVKRDCVMAYKLISQSAENGDLASIYNLPYLDRNELHRAGVPNVRISNEEDRALRAQYSLQIAS